MWTVEKIILLLNQYNPDDVVFFQDRMGREVITHDVWANGLQTLDVIIGVLPIGEGEE
tara:strand:+ start:5499 stop:5672 length:174 start_codon:yes stop_codon:yes gene_type:complete